MIEQRAERHDITHGTVRGTVEAEVARQSSQAVAVMEQKQPRQRQRVEQDMGERRALDPCQLHIQELDVEVYVMGDDHCARQLGEQRVGDLREHGRLHEAGGLDAVHGICVLADRAPRIDERFPAAGRHAALPPHERDLDHPVAAVCLEPGRLDVQQHKRHVLKRHLICRAAIHYWKHNTDIIANLQTFGLA